MRIHKYAFEIDDVVRILMPYGAQILHVDLQLGHPCMWALINLDHAYQERKFYIFGTGNPVPNDDRLRHVATFQQPPFVWHVFEVKELFIGDAALPEKLNAVNIKRGDADDS